MLRRLPNDGLKNRTRQFKTTGFVSTDPVRHRLFDRRHGSTSDKYFVIEVVLEKNQMRHT